MKISEEENLSTVIREKERWISILNNSFFLFLGNLINYEY